LNRSSGASESRRDDPRMAQREGEETRTLPSFALEAGSTVAKRFRLLTFKG